MFDSKYKKVLTVLLIIAIIAIVGLLCFLGYERFLKNKSERDASIAIEEFNRNNGITADATPETFETPDENGEIEIDIPVLPTSNGESSSDSNSDGKTYYKGFVMIGYIEIPRTNVNLPILETVTKKSLETSVVVLYPAKAQLNVPGNVVIAGHNYRNQTFFSNNKKLKEGDKIYITDESGTKLTYVVYKNFETTPEDTSFYVRDTGGVPEITLSTCTQDSNRRTIILARAQ